jgi:hypothetical protein
MKPENRIKAEADKYLNDRMMLVFGCIGIVMRTRYHWERNGIIDLYRHFFEVWKECASSNEKSMIQMLDEETGVEVQIGDGKSWRDMPYLNASLSYKPRSKAEWIYMRTRMMKWIPGQITACMLLALHRKCGFDSDQIADVYERLLAVEQDNLFDSAMACDMCERITKVRVREEVQ